jgi:hypothetical protein
LVVAWAVAAVVELPAWIRQKPSERAVAAVAVAVAVVEGVAPDLPVRHGL